MLVTFEGQSYTLDLDALDVMEARVIKRQTGLTVKGFFSGLREIDPDCVVAAYWLMCKQNGKAVDMHKVNFRILDFGSALSDAFKAEDKADEENPTDEPATAQQ